MTDLVGALEIGGTHVSAGRVDVSRALLKPPGIRRFALGAESSREALLGMIGKAATEVALPGIGRWGVAVPGPFDYERGVSKIRGVAKLDALYGVDLRDRLARDLGIERPERVRDVDASGAHVGAADLERTHEVGHTTNAFTTLCVPR